MQIVDTHAHLDFPTSPSTTLKELRGSRRLRGTSVDDLEKVLRRAKAAGVDRIITIGTSVESSKRCIEIADSTSLRPTLKLRMTRKLRGARENIPEIYATVGIHPKDGKSDIEEYGLDKTIGALRSIAQLSNKVVAIGECGLDYYLETRGQGSGTSDPPSHKASEDKQETFDEEKEFQRELFKAQVKLAAELKLPLVVHCRNGWDEIFGLVSQRGRASLGVFHCWTGNWRDAKSALDLGFYISFSGIVTFKNATDIQEVAKKMPIDRMLVETDSPFLTPEPLRSAQGKLGRGKTNEPKNVKIIAKFLSDIRNQSVDLIYQQTSSNAARLFSLK